MLWEIPALAVLMELRGRAVMEDFDKFELQVLYARAMSRVWEKALRLRELDDLRIADFGTRRRHSFLWQDWCVQAMLEGLGENFIGTSNCLIAKNRDVEAIGTNAHELPMVYSALASSDRELAQAPYRVLADWHEEHDGNLRIILPDTYGTKQFLDRAPDWLAGWTGIRIDSGDPAEGAETAISWWKERGEDPTEKLIIFSDGLDVEKIEELHRQFTGRARISFGWGTMLTNDFRGLAPGDALAPFSLVCKAVSANGRPTVKLSDNPPEGHGPGGRDRAIQARLRRWRAGRDRGRRLAVRQVQIGPDRQMIRCNPGQRCLHHARSVRADARSDGDPIERCNRPAGMKRVPGRDHFKAMQCFDAAAVRPLVHVAENDRWKMRAFFHRAQDRGKLPVSMPAHQPQVARDDAPFAIMGRDFGHDRAPRIECREVYVHHARNLDMPPDKDRVSVPADRDIVPRNLDRAKIGHAGNDLGRQRRGSCAETLVDFLQGEHVGAHACDYTGRSLGISPKIQTHALLNVPGRKFHRFH